MDVLLKKILWLVMVDLVTALQGSCRKVISSVVGVYQSICSKPDLCDHYTWCFWRHHTGNTSSSDMKHETWNLINLDLTVQEPLRPVHPNLFNLDLSPIPTSAPSPNPPPPRAVGKQAVCIILEYFLVWIFYHKLFLPWIYISMPFCELNDMNNNTFFF